MSTRLVVISPSRDESKYIRLTLESMVNQTRPPDRWVIVDDGSSDGTGDIAAEYAAKYPWIEVVRRERTGSRQLGPGVVSAFNAGLRHIGDDPYDVISKLDCDLEFGPEFIGMVLTHFDDPGVGMASGTSVLKLDSRMVSERYTEFHVPGMAKFYRRACFEQIRGLQPIYGWDILDETDARRHGWKTLSDPNIIFIHHRMQGSSFGAIRGRIIWGHGAYAIGSHPVFAVSRGIYRMFERPWAVGGLAFLYGFFSSFFNPKIKRTADEALIRYVRQEQIHRVLNNNRLPTPTGQVWTKT